MGINIGIDIGGSTTKIVGIGENELITPMQVKANDPVTSIYGAFGKFLSTNSVQLENVDHIAVTGVGASFLKNKILNRKTLRVAEFQSIALGGLRLTGLENAIIVSMGTGTAFVKADGLEARHLGGTGIGGGTLLGLSSRLLNIRHFETIIELASTGRLSEVDLTVGDLSRLDINGLSAETTASNFGRISDNATNGDIALGLINMVFQSIGMMAVFVARSEKTKDIVLCGNLTTIPQITDIFADIERMFECRFHIPRLGEYCTAVGAALAYDKGVAYDIIE